MKHGKKIGNVAQIPSTGPKQQQGVALAMSLMVLVVLTILGISGMKTGLLQSRMAVNAQDSATAFQGAESGLATSLTGSGIFDLVQSNVSNFNPDVGTSVKVTTSFESMSVPPRGSGYSATKYEVANFKQRSESSTISGARSTVSQGQYQIVNKSE